MELDTIKQIPRVLKSAVGKKCWYVSVGACTLPSFSLAFGGKTKRKKILRGAELRSEFSKYKPEIAFFVWCTWRMDGKNEVIVGSDDKDREICNGLKQLVGKSLVKFSVESPACDILLQFSDGLFLRVFCNRTRGNCAVNWTGRVRNKRISVGPGARVRVENEDDTRLHRSSSA